MSTYANACKKLPLENHFLYQRNKEIYCIFKTCCIMCVLFSTECCLFHNLTLFCSNKIQVFHKPYPVFKYQPGYSKVKKEKKFMSLPCSVCVCACVRA